MTRYNFNDEQDSTIKRQIRVIDNHISCCIQRILFLYYNWQIPNHNHKQSSFSL